MKKFLLIAAAILLLLSPLSAEILESTDDLIAFGLAHNLTYMKALYALRSAESDLDVDEPYESSSLAINSTAILNTSSNSWDTSMNLDLPLFDQLSLSANIDTDLDGSVGLTYRPFDTSDTTVVIDTIYEVAVVYLNELEKTLTSGIINAYLSYGIVLEEMNYQQKVADLEKLYYEDEKALYALGESSVLEVQEQFLDWIDKKALVRSKQSAVTEAKISLYTLLGSDSQDLELPEIDFDAITSAIAENDLIDFETTSSAMGSYTVIETQNIALRAQDAYDTQRLYDPDLKISSDINMAGAITTSVVFGIGFDDFKADEKDDLYDHLTLARAETLSKITETQFKIDTLILSLEEDKMQIEDVELEIQQNDLLIEEGRLLFEYGEYSDLDLQSLLLTSEQLELYLYSKIKEKYIHQLDLLIYSNK